MSYKVRIQSIEQLNSVVGYRIDNIGTETITYHYNNLSDTAYLSAGNYISILNSGMWCLRKASNGAMMAYGYSSNIFTMYGTDKTYVIDGAVNNNEPFEVELTTEPITEPCRLTSNRLSPPKFRLRKFFRINPLTSARALEVNGG